ncbi:MAG: hypothetical protein Q8916_03745 [Bacteroidota bacterium]|nr:hypothetical protein [Bacteroidota bacterium]MDP4236909.1 hypothetical protein [Bacteroidota bacterium]
MVKKGQLVSQYLERISADVFDDFIAVIKGYVGRRPGVYALYKGNKLYYVGLASNMSARLKQHLRDKHEGKWNRFSVYLTIGDAHLKEIESLVLRVIQPSGNSVKGKFGYAQNLHRRLKRDVDSHMKAKRDKLLGIESRLEVKAESYDKDGRLPVLFPYRGRVTVLRGSYKGKIIKARVLRDGRIRFKKQIFTSPSLAAARACESSSPNRNGWTFWKYERAPGDWVPLNKLKK